MEQSGNAQSRTLSRAPSVDAKAKTSFLQEILFDAFISSSGVEADKIHQLYSFMVDHSENRITDALCDELELDSSRVVKQASDHQAGTGLVIQNIFEADQER